MLKKTGIKIKYILLIAALVFIFAFLTGCSAGSTVDTVLKINPDLSGCRIMNVTLDNNAFKSNFSGDLSQLEELISENIPECMEWSVTKPETEEEAKMPDAKTVYSFVINFDSKEDYENKIRSILGEDITLNMEVPGNVWSFGVYVYEAYNSHDLLEWLIQAIVEEELVTTANSGYILGNGSNTVVFGQYSYETENYINVDSISNLPIDDITILMDVKPLNICDIHIIFDIPQETVEAKGTSIDTYMNRMNTEDVTLYKENGEGVRYRLEANDIPYDRITEILQTVMGEGHASVTVKESDGPQFSPFEKADSFEVSVDYINFLGKVNETTITRFLIKLPDGYILYDADNIDNLRRLAMTDKDYPEYQIFYDDCGNAYEKAMLFYHSYKIKSLNVNFKNSGVDWIKQSIFTLDSDIEDEELAVIKDAFLQRGRLQSAKISVQTSVNSDGMKVVYISEEGKTGDIVDSSSALYGGEKNNIYYMSERKAMKPLRYYGFIGEFDYSDIVKDYSEEFVFTCKIVLLGNIKLTNQDGQYIQSIKGNTAVFQYNEPRAFIQITGEKYDKRTIIIHIMLGIGLLSIFTGVFLLIFNKNKQKEQ